MQKIFFSFCCFNNLTHDHPYTNESKSSLWWITEQKPLTPRDGVRPKCCLILIKSILSSKVRRFMLQKKSFCRHKGDYRQLSDSMSLLLDLQWQSCFLLYFIYYILCYSPLKQPVLLDRSRQQVILHHFLRKWLTKHAFLCAQSLTQKALGEQRTLITAFIMLIIGDWGFRARSQKAWLC